MSKICTLGTSVRAPITDEPALDLTCSHLPDPAKPVETGGGGHCLFKSLSWYLTVTNTHHEVMRALIINFARANSDIFVRAFKDKREFDHCTGLKENPPFLLSLVILRATGGSSLL